MGRISKDWIASLEETIVTLSVEDSIEDIPQWHFYVFCNNNDK